MATSGGLAFHPEPLISCLLTTDSESEYYF